MGPACLAATKFSFTDPNVQWVMGGLAVVSIVGIIAVAMIDRWRKRQFNETFTPHDELASFRVLYQRGEMSQEEFERVKAQVMARLKKQIKPAVVAPPVLDELEEAPPEDQPPRDEQRSDGL